MSTICRHIRSNGERCRNVPAQGEYFCYLHEPGSRHISDSTRSDVFEQSGGQCRYCGKQLVKKNRSSGRGVWEPDHLRPYSQGGANTSENLVAACKSCNRARNDTGVREFCNGNRLCEAFNERGMRCRNPVTQGNYKYCYHHAS